MDPKERSTITKLKNHIWLNIKPQSNHFINIYSKCEMLDNSLYIITSYQKWKEIKLKQTGSNVNY